MNMVKSGYEAGPTHLKSYLKVELVENAFMEQLYISYFILMIFFVLNKPQIRSYSVLDVTKRKRK